MPFSPRSPAVRVGVLCGLLVVVSVVMIVVGLPEASLFQRRLLELSGVPLAGATALLIVHLAQELHPLPRRTRTTFALAGVTVGLGIVVMLLAYLFGWGTIHLGQTVVWVGLGIALIHVLLVRPKRPAISFTIDEGWKNEGDVERS